MIKPIRHSELTPELMRSGCFVLDMPNDEYHAAEGISKSGLDLIARSPAHFAYAAKREPTRAMALGTAIHTALLEPERFADEYVLLRDVKDRRASEYKQAVKVHDPERVLVASEATSVAAMQEAVLSQPEVKQALSAPGWRELSAFVECPDTGVILRCRFDLLTVKGHAYDLKKTRDARPAEFTKSVTQYRYHVQAAFYSRVYQLITGEPLQCFKFIACEDTPPHTAQVYELDTLAIEIGKFYAMRDLKTYASCIKSGEWPHPETDGTISVSNWAVFEYENDLEEAVS